MYMLYNIKHKDKPVTTIPDLGQAHVHVVGLKQFNGYPTLPQNGAKEKIKSDKRVWFEPTAGC